MAWVGPSLAIFWRFLNSIRVDIKIYLIYLTSIRSVQWTAMTEHWNLFSESESFWTTAFWSIPLFTTIPACDPVQRQRERYWAGCQERNGSLEWFSVWTAELRGFDKPWELVAVKQQAAWETSSISHNDPADILLEDNSSSSLLDLYWRPAEHSWKGNEMVPKPELTPHWEGNFQLKVHEKGSISDGSKLIRIGNMICR